MKVVVDEKYTIMQDNTGRVVVLRYGEPWRDYTGDNLILSLAQQLKAERERSAVLLEACKQAVANFESVAATDPDYRGSSNMTDEEAINFIKEAAGL